MLIAAYRFNDPGWFLIFFFASNFIILISATLVFGFVYRMRHVYKKIKEKGKPVQQPFPEDNHGTEEVPTHREKTHEIEKGKRSHPKKSGQ